MLSRVLQITTRLVYRNRQQTIYEMRCKNHICVP